MPPRKRVFGGKDGVSNASAVAKPVRRSVTTREMTKRLPKNANTDQLLKSDSDDENYDDKAKPERSPRKARKTPGKGKPTRGKKPAGRGGRRGKSQKRTNRYPDSEDDDEIQDSELEDDFQIEAEEEEPEAPVELGRSGRPKRGAAPAVLREESDEESMASASSSNDGEGEEEEEATRSAADNASSAPTRIVVLKFRNSSTRWKLGQHEALPADDPEPQQPPPPTRRITRATSATPSQHAAGSQRPMAGGKGPLISGGRNHPPKVRGRGASAEPQRRSGRLTQSNEPMAELSNSGNVVIINPLPVPSLIAEESSFEEPREEPKEEPKEQLNEAVAEAKTPESEPLSNGHSSQPEPVDEVIAEEQAPAAAAADPASRDDTGHEADEDEDDGPTRRTRTRTTTSRAISTPSPRTLRSAGGDPSSAEKGKASEATGARRLNRRGKPVRGASRKAKSDDDDYEEVAEDEHSDDSDSSHGRRSPVKAKSYSHDDEGDDSDVRSSRSKKRSRGSGSEEVESQAELQQELEDLQPSPKRTRRAQRRAAQFSGNESNAANEPRLRPRTQKHDYRLFRPELANVMDDNDVGTSTPSRRKMGGEPAKSLFDTNGPFGGGSVVPFSARGAGLIDSDSDSSDDEAIRRRGLGAGADLGGIVGMTPTGAHAPGLLPGIGQTHNTDPMGAPANLGKVTRPGKNVLADADPLGVSPDVTFDSVGGLDDRIQQLKEMVMLPLMYPEIFMAKKVTPPRGVLFHGPPGTGKTLMARAVASSFTGADGKKVTFYMRKGADCLSKWVGEAERQLRLLFEEARNNQPSIIFFDEIDGLAPVRSSKQEQIHASIVSTLLALMDGMDGRGQVVVIGATNRPDAVDPALRRPGRFDREFYFPLPTTEARRAIIDIHSRGWQPPLSDKFKDELAVLTKGYGGADLRALCTEAALNAMQRTYPQIYKSLDKLKVDPNNVVVTARDFMMSLKKITPSSERSSTSSAAPLPDHIKPLLSKRLEEIKDRLKGIFPEFKRLSPLEEAEYEDDIMDAEEGFEREMMMENFETARVFRPRLLIHGPSGLGQQYLAAATLHFMERVHVQSFDLGTLLSDATRTPETAIVQFFTEIKRHKPSVIFIPNVDLWYNTLHETAINTFKGLLKSISPNDRVLLFGLSEVPIEDLNPSLTKDLFGFSQKDRLGLVRPDFESRYNYFEKVMSIIRKSPRDFPQDPENRRKRKLPELERASPPPKREPTYEEKKAIALRDRMLKNQLKLRLHPLMEALKQKYRRFKKPAIDQSIIQAILEPPRPGPNEVVSDIPPQHKYRPYWEENGTLRVEDTESKKSYYNLDLDIVEDRYSNGYYSTPAQFLIDLEHICHDAKLLGDKENQRKANEMLTNAEVTIHEIGMDAAFVAQCEEMYQRELQRKADKIAQRELKQKEKEEQAKLRQIEATAHHSSSQGTEVARIPETSHDLVGPISNPKSPGQGSQLSNGVLAATTSMVASDGTAHTNSQPHSNGCEVIAGDSFPPSLSSNRDSDASLYATPPVTQDPTYQRSTQLTHMGSGHGGSVNVTAVSVTTSMVVNEASPTTSGSKRTSDAMTHMGSSPNINGYDPPNKWSPFGQRAKGDSQLPPTQLPLMSSQETGASQPIPPLIDSSPVPNMSSQPHKTDAVFSIPRLPDPITRCTEEIMKKLHIKLAESTSGYTVEQLEQVNAAITDKVWKSRTENDRDKVAAQALEVFEEVDKDVRTLQEVMEASRNFE